MSLTSLLIRKKAVDVDEGLDAVFRSSAGPSKIANDVQSGPSSSKSPLKAEKAKSLKRKPALDEEDDQVGPKPSRKKHVKKGDTEKINESESTQKSSKNKRKSKGFSEVSEAEEIDGDSDDDELENQYLSRTTKSASGATPLGDDGQEDSGSDEGDGSTELPVHESVGKQARKTNTKGSKLKYVPEDETREQRDARTVFVGNIPTEVVKSRPMLKQLRRHLLSHVPGAHIESTRFRSVAFKNPTAKLESEDTKGKGPSAGSASTKQQRQKDRASTWREQRDGEDTEGKSDAKTYMTPQEKRKVAFIKGEVHEQADSVNVYVVFAHPIPDELWPSNVPKREPFSPYEAAKLAVETCDGTTIFDRTIRVDLAGRDSALKSDGKAGAPIGTDPRLSVFVGNLDFASKEEDLRVFFEGLLSAERGAPSEDDDDGINGNAKPPRTWVTRVRIVKDRDTQLGKGFAYVQFADRECVDEMLAMEQEKLKFAKRKLRVQRCKTVPSSGTLSKVRSTDKTSSSSSTPGRRTSIAGVPKPTPIIPKGDPSLGERLAGLPKEVRKQTKASDADRVARRLAKKKARNALEKAGVKTQSKVRSRERTQKVAGSAGKKASGRKEGKGRVRSDKSMAKRNMKKQ
ncbi:hypothetical protein BD410DRAFT_769344 [Rickenella mellea]|uniref:Nucleolar protein 12 n=1 Tax=Rickenella mellea TaxID=50990 RepID=A0A4Y7Q6X1_9AGAM|nr:hypothetical protein BD410DRAFT_769344 [Rickenella mellea]